MSDNGDDPQRSRRPSRERLSLEAAIVARRYYLDGRQKSEIAAELGISRFKVARLLDDARASRLVRVHIEMPSELDLELGEKLAGRFGIRRSLVVGVDHRAPDVIDAQLGTAAAQFLSTRITADDVLGVAWGTTLAHAVDASPTFPACQLVQLMGGVAAAKLAVNGMELVRRLGEQTGSSAHVLHAPILVGSATTAEQLRRDASLAGTIDRFARLTVALVGIGSWLTGQSWFYREMPESERAELIAAGAAADVCSILLDRSGAAVTSPILDRTISISESELRAVPEVIAVAGGPDKVEAIAAALESGLVDILITDSDTARSLTGERTTVPETKDA